MRQLWKEDTLILDSCQLETDYVIKQPKETCQTTCRGHYLLWQKRLTVCCMIQFCSTSSITRNPKVSISLSKSDISRMKN